ncbi:MAG: MlaD family protein [Saprospiraceae bacterium]
MSKEVKLGILAIVAIFLAVWGYRYIKGQDLFSKNNTYHTIFTDVTGLGVSSDVTMNGYKIGAVTAINVNPKNPKSMDVYFTITGDYQFPKNTMVVMKSGGFVSGKILTLEYTTPCSGNDCIENGALLEGKSVGLIGSMISEEEVSGYVSDASGQVKELISSLGAEGETGALNNTVRELEATMANLSKLTENSNKLISSSSASMSATMNNLNKITGNMAASNAQITAMINNLSKTTEELSKVKLSNSVDTVNAFIAESKIAVELLQATLKSTNKTMTELEGISAKINSKDGSLGKLINDDAIYKDMDKTLNNLSLLLQDFRLNPKRYVNISLINKNKPYTSPENDPALENAVED